MNWTIVLNKKSAYGPVLIAQNVNIQYSRKAKNKNQAPTLTTAVLMTKARFDLLYRTTHAGAFGGDYGEVSETRVPVVKDAEFVGDESVYFVHKFPYDMFGDSGQFIPYDAVVDISLPVGTYPLWADGWFIKIMKEISPLYIVELNKHDVINNYTESIPILKLLFEKMSHLKNLELECKV